MRCVRCEGVWDYLVQVTDDAASVLRTILAPGHEAAYTLYQSSSYTGGGGGSLRVTI